MRMTENGGGFGFGDYEEGCGGSADSCAEAAAMTKSHLSLNSDAAATATAASADTLFLGPSPSSSGGMMGNSRAAFTLAQRDELERQTLIFKCMVSSTPVPPQLLLPLKSKAIIGSTGILCSSSSDPEPRRCRRTDGKKWRCSRDVAPHQKYCERHSHKNRPRSRKPVEFLSNCTSNKTHMQSRDSNFFSPPASGQGSVSLLVPYHGQKDFLYAMDSATPRSLEWFMKGEVIAVPNSEQLERQYQHGFVGPYEPDQELQGHGGGLIDDECNLLLRMTPLEGDNCSEGSASLSKRMPTPSLSLATFGGGEVGGGGEHDERKSFGHMGLGIRHHNVTNGWEGDPRAESRQHCMSPGGPLAEALRLGTPDIGKSPPCDRA